MDAKFSVIYQGKLVESMLVEDIEENLQNQYKISADKSKQFLSKNRIVKNGLTSVQAKKLQTNLLALGVKTRLLNESEKKSTTSSKNKLSRDEIDKIFQHKMSPIKTPFSYNIGLIVTFILTLFIPLLYLVITSFSVYGTYWFISSLTSIIDFHGNVAIKGLVAFSVIFMGVLLSLFLLRPLIPQTRKNNDEILDEQDHPELFYLIAKLSRYMSVPMPSEIRINKSVNASAGMKDGMRSLITGNLVLTLGLPLLSGMNMRQLVGVISHEFGHFSQRFGMTVYYAINTINYWLQERAFANYGLALLLKNWRDKYENGYVLIPIWMASAGIWLTQKIFKYLFQASLYISQNMTRQMEYNADHHECRVVGSDYFSTTSIRLHELNYAREKVKDINTHFWNENMLLKDIPKAINSIANELSAPERRYVKESMGNQETHPWDSHPADHQRIEHALKQQEPAKFICELPSSLLMNEFETLCEKHSLKIYNGTRDRKFDRFVRNNDILFKTKKQDEVSDERVKTLLMGIDLGQRIPNIPVKLPDNLMGASLTDIHSHFVSLNDRIKKCAFDYNQARSKRYAHNQANAYVQAGFNVDAKAFQLTNAENKSVEQVLHATEITYKNSESDLACYDQLITARINAFCKNKPNDILIQAREHLKALKSIKNIEDNIEKSNIYSVCIDMLVEDEDQNPAIVDRINSYQIELAEIIKDIWNRSKNISAVNRYSNERINLIDFSETWQKKPIIELEKLPAYKLANYSQVLGDSIRKQYFLHLKELVMIIQ